MALGTACNLGRCTRSHYAATLLAAFRAYVYNIVGNLNDVGVMLDDYRRISAVYQFRQNLQQLAYILEMQSRRRFIQNIESAARIPLRKLR